MLPGMDGRLVSAAFLEAEIPAADESVERARREFQRARISAGDLGPASPARAVMERAAAPLAAVLGFGPPSRIESADRLTTALRDGVLTASTEILRALAGRRSRGRDRAIAVDEAFEQALTIVYRILFLLFAEARALVPLWHPIYRESYSIESVRDDAERSPRAAGLWDALRAVARLAHTGCRAGELRVTPEDILRLRIVDPAMGSGAFLVAACRYLAAAYEAALVEAGGCLASDIGEPERAAIRRTIAERCLYGVDLNPMAVQLARLSLWLATLAADRPVSFLDHRLQAGDSLLGAWLAQLRRPPIVRRAARTADGLPLLEDKAIADAMRSTLPVRFSLESLPNDTIEQVRVKERAYSALTSRDAALSRWKQVAHLWCAAWLAGDAAPPASAFGSLSDVALTGRGDLPAPVAARFLDRALALGEARRLFHWELEFPEAFFDADGRRRPRAGFDAVIGNPPWDMMRADAGGSDARSRARAADAPVVRFTRDAGVYTAQSDGHANRYQVFLERAVALTRPGGRFGLVLPSGLATDHGSAALRRLLLSRCDVDAIVGIDNHRGVFPIHRSVRFLLLTATSGAPSGRSACRCGT